MQFNAKKCYVMSIRNTSSHLYKLDNTILQQVSTNPYLGITLSEDLQWTTHIQNIVKNQILHLGFLPRNLTNCPEEYKNSNSKTWEKYRAQRNLVNKIKKKSVSTYFQKRCVGGIKSNSFWKTIKPYLSKKNTSGPSKVILTENSKLITKQNEVSEFFNSFFLQM